MEVRGGIGAIWNGGKMASPKQNPFRTIGRQIQSILPTQPFNAPKTLEDAKLIETIEAVPEGYREFFLPYLSRGEVFPYTVLTPSYEVSAGTVTAKLICAIDHTFYVLEEQDEDGLLKACYPIDEMNYVEVIHRPADLQITIHGVTNLGRPAVSVFGCSRSTSPIVAPLLQRIRLRIVALNEKAPSRHTERLDRWNELNTQVLDMARHCLMPGETVIESILQPEIRTSLFSPDRAMRGEKCAPHICILTDKELVMIREDPALSRKDQFGSICHFVPLNKISSLKVTHERESLLVVSVRILNGEVFESLFDVSLENEVIQFLSKTHELMPKEKLFIRD